MKEVWIIFWITPDGEKEVLGVYGDEYTAEFQLKQYNQPEPYGECYIEHWNVFV